MHDIEVFQNTGWLRPHICRPAVPLHGAQQGQLHHFHPVTACSLVICGSQNHEEASLSIQLGCAVWQWKISLTACKPLCQAWSWLLLFITIFFHGALHTTCKSEGRGPHQKTENGKPRWITASTSALCQRGLRVQLRCTPGIPCICCLESSSPSSYASLDPECFPKLAHSPVVAPLAHQGGFTGCCYSLSPQPCSRGLLGLPECWTESEVKHMVDLKALNDTLSVLHRNCNRSVSFSDDAMFTESGSLHAANTLYGTDVLKETLNCRVFKKQRNQQPPSLHFLELLQPSSSSSLALWSICACIKSSLF